MNIFLKKKSVIKNTFYNFFIVIFSVAFSLLITVLICEGFFYLKKCDFFYKKSIHFKIQDSKKNYLKDDFDTKKFEKYKILNEKIITILNNQNIENEIDFSNKNISDFQNSLLVYGAWIKTNEPKKIKLNILRDGILFESPYHSGSNNWEYLSVSAPIKYRFNNGQFTSDTSAPFIKTSHVKTLISSAGINYQYYNSPIILRPLRERGSYYKYDVEYKKGKKIRIAILGGSTTFNIFIPHEDGADYPFQLQQMFDSLYPGKFDILNYGYPAANTRNFLQVAKELAFQAVDLIIIVPSWNDSGDYIGDNYYKSKPIFSSDIIKYLETSFFNQVAIGYYIKKVIMRVNQYQINNRRQAISKIFEQSQNKGYAALTNELENKFFNEAFYNNLKQLINFFKENNIEVILSNLPYLRFNNLPFDEKVDHIPFYKDLEASVNYTDILKIMDNEVIPKIANEENIKFINLQKNSAFNHIDYIKRQMYFHDAIHFTSKGTRIISYEIFKELNSKILSKLYPDYIENLNSQAQKNYLNYDNFNIIKLKNGNFESNNKFEGSLNNWNVVSENDSFRSDSYENWRRNNSHAATSTHDEGKLVSNKFTIDSDHLFFLMKGKLLNKKKIDLFTGIKIYVDNNLIKSIAPSENCEKQFCDFIINLKQWRGHIGRIEIIDGNYESEIQVDNLRFE